MGTRLREETETKPKPMINVGGKPILWHIMKIYSHYGFKDFVLCLGYRGEVIKDYFLNYEAMNTDFTIELDSGVVTSHNNHEETGWQVTLADTGEKAMTGARIKKIEKYIDGDLFMVTYGDGLADIDIQDLVKFHKSHGRIVTVTGVRPASRFGELETNGDEVSKFGEKPQTKEGLVNGGFFILDTRVFSYLTEEDDCIFEGKPLERLAADGELMVYRHPGFWQCMDTYRDLQLLNNLWAGRADDKELYFDRISKGRGAPWKVWG
ncbi:glucose-1-phosphate cytidylyltransferase [Desulfosarcina alkanivorans]|uniref:Glucose-1-phosphate cytidylyltransferase n=2 Tax=Desulfosarcina alkanivorans TaxID=571177 RepID=A0A5K7YDK5_9BACT|nr:glucose-1-phosphate cytidylyltransferase [Desulfosarcina alkanivorans]